jgi:hypothetical protein
VPASLTLPEPLLASTRAFLVEQGIPLEAGTGPGDLAVVAGERGQESDGTALAAGGRIRCALALALARRLGLSGGQFGALLDHLDVKVHDCSLGCF